MSTFAPDLVLLATLFAAAFLSPRHRFHAQPPMQRPSAGRGGYSRPPQLSLPTSVLMAATAPAGVRLRQLVHQSMGMQPPQQPEYGRAARVSPLRRIRSVILLLGLLVVLGIATAASVGVVAFLAGFLLEQAIK